MPDWKTTLDVSDLHAGRRSGSLTIQEVASGVAQRLRRNRYFLRGDVELSEIVEYFEDVASDPEATTGDYDGVLSDLYDFADRGHRIWVKSYA